MGYGDSYVQNFSTCSKWQLIHSMCCQHTKEYHKPISHITIMSYKPIFHASLYHTHTMYYLRASQTYFFTWKTNTTYCHLPTQPPFSLPCAWSFHLFQTSPTPSIFPHPLLQQNLPWRAYCWPSLMSAHQTWTHLQIWCLPWVREE